MTFIGVVQEFHIPLDSCRVASTLAFLPSAADGVSLGLTPGVHGTNTPRVVGALVTNAAVSENMRFSYILPCSTLDSIADTLVCVHARVTAIRSVSATVTVAAYTSDDTGGISANLVETTIQNVNSTDWVDYLFYMGATSPPWNTPGALLDVLITGAIDDTDGTAEGGVEIGKISFRVPVVA